MGSLDKTPLSNIKYRSRVVRLGNLNAGPIETAINNEMQAGWDHYHSIIEGTRILLFFKRERNRNG